MWEPYAVTAGALIVMAVIGARATEIGPWYRALRKPTWQPPDWLFGPVWTTIYLFITWSVGRVWPELSGGERWQLIVLLGVNFALNIAWSVLFFSVRRPVWGLIEIVPLWLSIVALMAFIAPHDTVAAWMLAPYVVWVAIAAWLNLTIVRLNPDAHRLVPDGEPPGTSPSTSPRTTDVSRD